MTEHDLKAMPGEASVHGKALPVVDVCGGFGTLPVLVARVMGADVAHMPSRSFATASETYGEDKNDETNSPVLADTTRWRPSLAGLIGDGADPIERAKAVELLARYKGPNGFRKVGKARCPGQASKLPYQRTCGPGKVEEAFGARNPSWVR